jgi:SAM-dependent methyltransferase
MNCCVCGAGSDNTTIHIQAAGFRLVRCRACGLVYLPEKPVRVMEDYGKEYFTDRNEYVGRRDEFHAAFEELVGKIRRRKNRGHLLDVGTGIGILMEVATKEGFRVSGVEVSPWASSFARAEKGLEVFTGTLEEAHFPGETFEVVVLNHVLEHLEHPVETLRETRRILKRDGVLVIGVPNIESIMARLLGTRWYSLKPNEHIWHFTPATLCRLVREAGFEVIEWESRENNRPSGGVAKRFLQTAINAVAVLTNRSEAMLLFARRDPRGDS